MGAQSGTLGSAGRRLGRGRGQLLLQLLPTAGGLLLELRHGGLEQGDGLAGEVGLTAGNELSLAGGGLDTLRLLRRFRETLQLRGASRLA